MKEFRENIVYITNVQNLYFLIIFFLLMLMTAGLKADLTHIKSFVCAQKFT